MAGESKRARSKNLNRSESGGISRGIPSLSTIKKDAIKAFKDEANDKFNSLSSFLPEGVADDAIEYAEQAVKWLRRNPGAATAVAVVSGVAVGAIVRQALIGGQRKAF